MAADNLDFVPELKSTIEVATKDSLLDNSHKLLLQNFANDDKEEILRLRRAQEMLPIGFFARSELTSSGLHGDFLWFQFFLEIVLRMKKKSNTTTELTALWAQVCEGNAAKQDKMDEFQSTYSANDAIKWYTRDCGLYRQLNKAFRQRDLCKLFSFSFFIADLYHQLQDKHNEQIQASLATEITTWHGQMMAKSELDQLRTSVGELMSVNSFFSTTPDYLVAYGFSEPCEGFVQVLFEIEIDTSLKDTKPFADITQLSNMPGEKEILFGMGAIFRIVSIEDCSDVWWVKIKLCNDNDTELKPLLDRLSSRIGEETSVGDFAIVLYEMGMLSKAEEVFEKLLKVCPKNHPNTIEIHRLLGEIADELGNYDQAVNNYRETIRLEKELLPVDDPRRAITLLDLSVTLKSKNDINSALLCLQEALSIWQSAPGEHQVNIARCLNNMGTLFINTEPYQALEYFEQALTIRRRFVPANDAEIAKNLGNIGGVHVILGHHDLALKYAKETLDLLTDRLPSMSLDIADAYRNVGVAHGASGQYHEAFYFYTKAAAILKQIVEPNHPRRLQINQDCARALIKRCERSFNTRFDQMLALALNKLRADHNQSSASTDRTQ